MLLVTRFCNAEHMVYTSQPVKRAALNIFGAVGGQQNSSFQCLLSRLGQYYLTSHVSKNPLV